MMMMMMVMVIVITMVTVTVLINYSEYNKIIRMTHVCGSSVHSHLSSLRGLVPSL